MKEEYVTVKEFARKIGCTTEWIYQLIRSGEITNIKQQTPRKIKIHVKEYQNFI